MPFFGQSPGCPDLLPFDRRHRLPGDGCRPDHVGWSPSRRHRSRGPVCWLPSPVSSRRHTGFPMTVPPVRLDRLPDLHSRRRNPGLLVAQPRWPLDAVHADPVTRAIAGRRRTFPEVAVGVLARFRPVASPSAASGCPVTRCFEAVWLLAPTGTASASWAGSVLRLADPEGSTQQTRSLDPGLRALSGTRHTFAPVKPQVKNYF